MATTRASSSSGPGALSTPTTRSLSGSASVNRPPTAAGLRKRTTRTSNAAQRSGGGIQFYTDDQPGLKISPVVVVIISVGFIAAVSLLHVIGKLRGG